MLSKIFGYGHKKRNKKVHQSESDDDSWLENFHLTERGLPKFEKSQVRVIVFKDRDKKGDRCVLFDSKIAIQEEARQNADTERQRRRLSPDAQLLGEMVFGSVEMTYKGPTVKVHSIRTPPQLLLTKVFALKPHRASHGSPATQPISEYLQASNRFTESVTASISSQQSQNNSSDSEEHLMAKSVPACLSLPSPTKSFQLQNVVEGPKSSVSEINNSLYGTFPRTSSGSYQRRLLRSQVTRMDYGCLRRNESFNEETSMRLRRRPKIGIGVLFSMWEDKDTSDENNRLFQSFCFSHFPVIESHVHQLRRRIEKALTNSVQISGKTFHDALLNATNIFADNIYNLYYAPRIKSPVWLTMLSQPDQCDAFCEDLVPQLVDAIETCNTKETNFFMASLLTAVLTHHLAWVATVTPSSVQARRAYLDKHSSEALNLLGKSHPYNPLWAQLSDLYGAVGDPPRIARTVITGKDKNLVTKLLHILSYFIRCSEVYEQPVEQPPNLPTDSLSASTSENLITSTEQADIQAVPKDSGKILPESSENSSQVSGKTLETNCEGINSGNYFEKTLCELCNKLAVTVKEQPLEDCFLDKTFEACSCGGVFTGNSKENKMWRSFLRTSCCDLSCRNSRKESKWSTHGSDGLNLDRSCLTGSNVPGERLKNNLKRKNSFEKKTERPSDYQNGTFCIQNDGKTISLDRQSIVNMFLSSFPLCPICQGRLCFFHEDAVCCKKETVRNPVETGFCDECDKLKACCCQMLNIENTTSGSCDSSTTVISDDYSSGISVHSCEGERDSLSCVSIDSGLNVQCSQSTENVNEKCLTVDQPQVLELPELERKVNNPAGTATSSLDCQLFSFGRSLMAGYCDQYLPDFVLHGTKLSAEEQRSYDLKISLEQPVVDSPVLESVLIVANTDNWECTVKSQKKSRKGVGTYPNGSHSKKGEYSKLVNDILTSFCNLSEMNMSAQFCLMHLEDRMKEIYLKSKVISEYLLTQTKYVTMRGLMSTFGYDECDLALLMSVIGVHSPQAISRMPIF